MMQSFEVDSCIHAYHAYSVIWTPTFSEHISCEREIANTENPYAVAVMFRSTAGEQLLQILPVCIRVPCMLSQSPFSIEMKSPSSTGTCSAIHIASRASRNSVCING